MSPLAHLLALPVRAYRLTFKSWVGHNCRFEPTCSCYTLQALERHGAFKGGMLAVWRILRCNPWGGMGFDPVPGCAHYDDDCRCHPVAPTTAPTAATDASPDTDHNA